jgi:signal transduction histidine kinase
LRGMNERLRDLGGTIELRPAKKRGAIVRAVVPVKQQQPALDSLELSTKENDSAA